MHSRLVTSFSQGFVAWGVVCVGLVAGRPLPAAVVVDFEELSVFTGSSGDQDGQAGGQFYNGNSGSGTNSTGWTSQGVQFTNSFDNTTFPGFESWEGWAYSNVQNRVTAGFFNQYAVYSEGGNAAGYGAGNSRNYALAFTGSSVLADGTPQNGAVMTLPTSTTVISVDLANTTYAARYFRDGLDGFGTPDFSALDQFGDGDFFRLVITGFDQANGAGTQVGQVSLDLANWAGAGTADDVYLQDWTTVDLSGLGAVRSLRFSLTSSQIDEFVPGQFGISTPSYVAVDNLRLTAVPEPWWGCLVAGSCLLIRRRR